MNNQQPVPFVSREEYDRNKGTIASYRAYLDMYEQMNEQGRQNHEERQRIEQIDRMLLDRIREGEEARRQLSLLRQQSGALRITDSHTTFPAIFPATPAVLESASSSAYIEEIQEPRTQANDHMFQGSYSSHKPTQVQPSPYDRQWKQQPSTVSSDKEVRYDPPVQRHVPTPTMPTQPSTQNVPQGFHTNNSVQQQSGPRFAHQARVNPYNVQSAQPTFTQGQVDYYRQAQRQNANAGHAPSSQQPITLLPPPPPRYYPTSQAPAAQNRVSTSSQPSSLANRQERQVGSQSILISNNAQEQQRPMEIVTRVQESSKASNIISNSTPAVDTTGTNSSLDGALGPTQQKQDGVKLPNNTPIPLTAPKNVSTLRAISLNETPKVSSHEHSPPAVVNAIRPVITTQSVLQTPPASSSSVGIPIPSPMKTPKDADKKHLARDILRALKRPRPEIPETIQPDSKRHATEASVRQTKQVAEPTSSTPLTNISTLTTTSSFPENFTTPASRSTPSAVSIAPAVQAQSFLPPHNSSWISTTTLQTTAPSVNHAELPSVTSSTPATNEVLENFYKDKMQKYPEAVSASTLDKIRQKYLSGQFNYAALSNQTGNYGQLMKTRIVPPVSRAPDQPLASTDIQTPSQLPGLLNEIQVKPYVPFSVDPLSVSTPVPEVITQTSSASDPVVGGGPERFENAQVPSVPIANKAATPGKTPAPVILSLTDKTPLFLPSPTSSSHELNTSAAEAEGVSIIVSTDSKDEGKARAIGPSTSPSLPLPSVPPTKESISEVPSGSKLVFAYVSVPPLPKHALRLKKQLPRDDELNTIEREFGDLGVDSRSRSPSWGDYARGASSSPPKSNVSSDVIDLVFEESDTVEDLGSWDLHFASYDEAEKEVLHENCIVLKQAFCRWLECEVALNSPGALLRHLTIVHGPRRISASSPWTCEWTGCGYTCISKEDFRQHIERHALYPLSCPYIGCSETFRTPRQLIRHKRSDHANDDVLQRPTAELSKVTTDPSTPRIPPTVPKIIPTYMIEYSLIQPASITRQRHEAMMPLVLRRISGNVPTQLHSYNLARPMPTTPSRSDYLDAPAPVNTPYSFLQNRSTRYSSFLSTPAKSKNFMALGSTYTTNLVKKGLVLWPQKEGKALPEEMIEELEEMEDVAEELLDGEDAEGHDVFGPTIEIKAPGTGAGSDVADDHSGVRGSPMLPSDERVAKLSA